MPGCIRANGASAAFAEVLVTALNKLTFTSLGLLLFLLVFFSLLCGYLARLK